MATNRRTPKPLPVTEDHPFTALMPDGRTLFVLVPARWCERDISGEVCFKPHAVRLIDRIQVMAMKMPANPSPGFILTLRDALGLTQSKLAKLVGVDAMTVSRWERGAVRPSPAAVRKIEKLRRDAGRKGLLIAA